MMLNATSNNISAISWRSVLLVEDIGVPGEHHQPAASHWQFFFCIILYRVHLAWAGFELTTLVVVGTDWIYSCNYNYHMITITTKTFPNLIQIHNNYMYWLFYILLCLLILCCYRILFCWVLLLSCTGWRPIKCSQCPLWKLCWIAVVVRNSSSFCLHWLMQTLYISNAVSTMRHRNDTQGQKTGKLNNLKDLGRMKTKGPNRLAKVGWITTVVTCGAETVHFSRAYVFFPGF